MNRVFLIVFLKSCVLLKPPFIVFSANTAVAVKKMYVEEKQYIYEKLWLFLAWQRGVFCLGVLFSYLIFLVGWLVFVCFFLRF